MRIALAIVLGLLAGSVITFGIESVSTIIFPLPEGADPTDLEWIKANVHKIPTGSMLVVAIAHMIGIIVGMVVATKISVDKLLPAYLVGVLLMAATAVNLFMIPHPMWFTITDIAGALVGFGIGKILSGRLVAIA